MADLKSLSIPEILAYCRNADGEGGDAAPSAEPAAAPEPAAEPAPAAPAAAASAGPADRSKMSVADMLAAARGEKAAGGGGAAAAPKAKAAPKPKPAAKAGGAAKAPAKPAKTGPMDTSSILAAARAGTSKPGPITKAEAAARAKGAPDDAKKKEKPKAPPMPAKPEYAKPVPASAKAETTRRGMMEILFGSMLAVGWGAMVMAAGISSLVMARFFFPNLLVEPPSQFKIGFPGDFSAGTVATKFKAQFGVWVVNAEYEGTQQIVALKSVCTHLGCTPNWLEAEQKFKCPCHGSGFYKEGINFEGPAPRPLERYAIKLADDGQIEIDKSKTFQEQLGQWNDGASFVPV